MKDVLVQWMERDDIAKQRAIVEMREIMADASEEEERTNGIIVERLFDEKTRDEGIKLYVEPTDITSIEDIESREDIVWNNTPIGELLVSDIHTNDNGQPSISVYFRRDVGVLLQYRKGEYGRGIRSREIPLNADGIGWDELGKKDASGEKVERDSFGLKPDTWQKWLIVDIGRPLAQISEIPQLQAAAD